MSKDVFPGTVEDYNGYTLHRFTVDGCEAIIVEPLKALPGRQWVWKAEFFTAFPKFELEALRRGYYLVFITVGNTFGCPSALKHWDVFYRELTGKYDFARRAVLLGLSRGGLYIYNWAAKNTDKVACIYADNAVCDFKSWPGGKGCGPGSSDDWKKLLVDYGFSSDAEAVAYSGNPIDNLAVLADQHIPLIHASGTDDETVPIAENTDIVEQRYQALGGLIKVIRHPGGHHPHGLEDPAPVIDFIMQNSLK